MLSFDALIVVEMLFDLCNCLFFQGCAVPRSFPLTPESGEAPEDADTEAVESRAADSEATVEDAVEDAESSKGIADDAADEVNDFIMAPRPRDVESLSDSESSPEADDPALVDAAPRTSPTAAPKQPKGGFADEDDLFS